MLKRRSLLLIATFIVISMITSHYAWVKWQTFMDDLGGIDREYYKKMTSIRVGMTESQVVDLLGEPPAILYAEYAPKINQEYGLYGKEIKNINKCLIYYHGIDLIGHYFLDEDGKVYFVNVGGT